MRPSPTLRGVARSIIRGVKANFAPENQQAELERLAELFQDMAMSCEMEADMAPCRHIGNPTARRDADILGGIALWIEDDTPQILLNLPDRTLTAVEA